MYLFITHRHIYRRRNKILEAVIVGMVTAASGYLLVYLSTDCEVLGNDPTEHPVQVGLYPYYVQPKEKRAHV